MGTAMRFLLLFVATMNFYRPSRSKSFEKESGQKVAACRKGDPGSG